MAFALSMKKPVIRLEGKAMKKLFLILMAVLILALTGCATTKVTTDIGARIGESFQESAGKGMISAEQSIKAWPYVSGQLKGLMAANYRLDLSPMAADIISDLDKLAKKDALTTEEKGFVIGSFVRLEAIAIKDGWDRYGVSVYSLTQKAIGL